MAVLGIYGVIGYAVGQRTREFGIRLALGARPGDVRRDVVLGGARLAAIGLALGIPGAWLLTRVLEGALYEITPTDPRTFAAVAALLVAVALVGAWLPARRAGRVDPTTSLSEG
jgi:ABC-type antimicrobial peptide transport system permease subunit